MKDNYNFMRWARRQEFLSRGSLRKAIKLESMGWRVEPKL